MNDLLSNHRLQVLSKDSLSKYKERLNQLDNGYKEIYIGEKDNIKAIIKALSNEVYNE